MKEHESPKDSLKRELNEETNLDMEVRWIVGGHIEQTLDRTKTLDY
jgi:ADP-ribose pyrophosphatase YjhB (NUDIX family)